jgi:2-polyprenyl-3-methyl-5-hydroxy-6-metoxy-1,4-benzoquinol methylase
MSKSNNYYQGNRSEMLRFIPSESKKILEIGCGEGNAEVWGIDYEANRVNVAQNKLDKVFCGDVAILLNQLPNNYFDTIVCNDVLEHLIDPYMVLKGLKEKLTSNGVVVSSIPNIRYFRNFYDLIFKKNWDYTEQGVMDFTHLRFFTINSIRKMYENLNFSIVKLEGIHPTKSLKALIPIFLTFGYCSDIKYIQFATVAKIKQST